MPHINQLWPSMRYLKYASLTNGKAEAIFHLISYKKFFSISTTTEN